MIKLANNYLEVYRQAWSLGVEMAIETMYLLPAVAMIFVSVVPAEALGFVEEREASHRPLRFVRDLSLSDQAVVDTEAFPATRNHLATSSLHARTSRIRDVVGPLVPGMTVRVLATAYSSEANQTDASPFTTAAGTQVEQGTLAANFLPFGTRVRIGGREYTVLDRMNERYNRKYIVDLWFSTRAAAVQFGVQQVDLEIIALPAQ